MTEKVAILHTNDIHSHLENWPKIRRYIKAQRAALQQAGYQVLVFDIGDAIDRAHPLTAATDGRANVELMNQIDYDAVTIGNNEGLNDNHEQLAHLYDDANFDVVLDNLKDQAGNQPKWAKQVKRIVTPAGTKIAILGMTAPYQLTYPLVGWNVLDPQAVLQAHLDQLAEPFDVLFLLSHLGVSTDRQIASRFPQFDVIFGAHSHHLLEHGELDNHSLLTGCQKWGHYVGTVKLTIDDDHHVIDKQASVVKVAELPAEKGDQAEIAGYQSRGEQMLAARKVADIPDPIEKDWVRGGEFTRLGLAAMERKAGTKAAVINAGLFLRDLPAGVVDRNQIHELLPHSMHVMKTTFNGYNLWRLVREMEQNKRILNQFPQKGMGFRGKVFGQLVFDGIEYDPKTDQVFFDGQVVKNEAHYEIALLDHYLFVPFFPTVAIAGENHLYFDQLLRDVFIDYLAATYPLTSK